MGELLKSEMAQTHRSRRDASKSPERQLRNSKVEGKTWAIGSTERCSSKEERQKERMAKERAKARTIEFKSIGKIRDDGTRQKGSKVEERVTRRGKKNQFWIKVPTMEICLLLFRLAFPLAFSFSFYIKCHWMHFRERFLCITNAKEPNEEECVKFQWWEHWWLPSNKLSRRKVSLSWLKLQRCKRKANSYSSNFKLILLQQSFYLSFIIFKIRELREIDSDLLVKKKKYYKRYKNIDDKLI